MQRPDEKKRRDIMKVAEALFAKSPFHEVKLEDIAAKAKIGKGTIYIYFRDKEDLLVEVLRDGTSELLERIRSQLATLEHATSSQQLQVVFSELANYATTRPHMYRLVRTLLPKRCALGLRELRGELASTITDVIRRGITRGEMSDPHPELTAQYVLGSARGVAIFAREQVEGPDLAAHLMRVFGSGLCCTKERSK